LRLKVIGFSLAMDVESGMKEGSQKEKKKTQKQKIKRVVKVCVLSKRCWTHMGDCCPVENNIASIVCSWYVFVYK
jgi:hypothetical protein